MASFSGLKKQMNKANQYMTERITGVEGTKMDSVVQDMEHHTDVYNEMVEDLQVKTKEFLQPNPTVRAKMAAVKGISKLSGQAKASTYPQPEGTLGEAMGNYGRKLIDNETTADYATALIEMGESLKKMADHKYTLDDTVKQNYLEPLHQTQSKDLKDVMHHRKKMQGHKLDFDYKKRTSAPETELKMSEDKLADSLQSAQLGMHHLLTSSGIDQVSRLAQLSVALLDYHRHCVEVLQPLSVNLLKQANATSSRPRLDFNPKTLGDLGISKSSPQNGNNRPNPGSWKPHSPSQASTMPTSRPSCKALYNFNAENPSELSFREGEIINLKGQVDANWYDGELNGRSGYFPVAFVSIIVPLTK